FGGVHRARTTPSLSENHIIPQGIRVSEVEDDLADGLSIGDVLQRGHDLVERKRGTDVRPDSLRGQQLEQLAFVARELVRRVRCEVDELEAENVDAFEQDQVERYARDLPGRVADCHEAPTPSQCAERGFGQVATYRIDDDVTTVGQRVTQR